MEERDKLTIFGEIPHDKVLSGQTEDVNEYLVCGNHNLEFEDNELRWYESWAQVKWAKGERLHASYMSIWYILTMRHRERNYFLSRIFNTVIVENREVRSISALYFWVTDDISTELQAAICKFLSFPPSPPGGALDLTKALFSAIDTLESYLSDYGATDEEFFQQEHLGMAMVWAENKKIRYYARYHLVWSLLAMKQSKRDKMMAQFKQELKKNFKGLKTDTLSCTNDEARNLRGYNQWINDTVDKVYQQNTERDDLEAFREKFPRLLEQSIADQRVHLPFRTYHYENHSEADLGDDEEGETLLYHLTTLSKCPGQPRERHIDNLNEIFKTDPKEFLARYRIPAKLFYSCRSEIHLAHIFKERRIHVSVGYGPLWRLLIMDHTDRNMFLQETGHQLIDNADDVRNVGQLISAVKTKWQSVEDEMFDDYLDMVDINGSVKNVGECLDLMRAEHARILRESDNRKQRAQAVSLNRKTKAEAIAARKKMQSSLTPSQVSAQSTPLSLTKADRKVKKAEEEAEVEKLLKEIESSPAAKGKSSSKKKKRKKSKSEVSQDSAAAVSNGTGSLGSSSVAGKERSRSSDSWSSVSQRSETSQCQPPFKHPEEQKSRSNGSIASLPSTSDGDRSTHSISSRTGRSMSPISERGKSSSKKKKGKESKGDVSQVSAATISNETGSLGSSSAAGKDRSRSSDSWSPVSQRSETSPCQSAFKHPKEKKSRSNESITSLPSAGDGDDSTHSISSQKERSMSPISERSVSSERASGRPSPILLYEDSPQAGFEGNGTCHPCLNSLMNALVYCPEFIDQEKCYKENCILCKARKDSGMSTGTRLVEISGIREAVQGKLQTLLGDENPDVAEILAELINNCEQKTKSRHYVVHCEEQRCEGCFTLTSERSQLFYVTLDMYEKRSVQEAMDLYTAVKRIEKPHNCNDGKPIGHTQRIYLASLPLIFVLKLVQPDVNDSIHISRTLWVEGFEYHLQSIVVSNSDGCHTLLYHSNIWYLMKDWLAEEVKETAIDNEDVCLLFYNQRRIVNRKRKSVTFAQREETCQVDVLPDQKETSQVNVLPDQKETCQVDVLSEPAAPERTLADHPQQAKCMSLQNYMLRLSHFLQVQHQKSSSSHLLLDPNDWQQFHDIGICLLAVDTKVTDLLRHIIASEIYEQLEKSKTNELEQTLKECMKWVEGSRTISHQYDPSFEERDDQRRENIKEIFLACKSVSQIDNWPTKLIGQAANFTRYIMSQRCLDSDILNSSDDEIVKFALSNPKISKNLVIRAILSCIYRYNLTVKDLQTHCKDHCRESLNIELTRAIQSLSSLRNSLVHSRVKQTFSEDERRRFIAEYRKFIEMFDFKRYFDENSECVKSQYLTPSINKDEYVQVLTAHNQLLIALKDGEKQLSEGTQAKELCENLLESCNKELGESSNDSGSKSHQVEALPQHQ